jgi:hypothetical protein
MQPKHRTKRLERPGVAALRGFTIAVITVVCILALRRPATATETYRLSADRVALYTNSFVLEATGNVQLDLGSGRAIKADFFFMNLRGNRFIVAGNVRFQGPNVDQTFAALSADLVAKRAYAIVANDDLERWSFDDNDFAHPQRDAHPPSDAFELPVITDPATKLGRKVVIGARDYVRYGRCVTQFIGGAGLYIPVPDCYVNVSDDPDLAQSALSGSNLGGEISLTGSANAISGIYINYDRTNGLYAALQQNISSPKAWAVFAVTASGHPGLSFIGAATPSDSFGVRVSTDVQSLAPAPGSALSGFRYSDVRLAQTLPFGYAELFATSAADNGTGPGFLSAQPTSAQFDLVSPNVPLGSTAFGTMRIGYGVLHDPSGLQQLGPTNYSTLGFGYADAGLSAPAIPIGGADTHRRIDLGLLASQSLQRFSIAHETAITTAGLSLTKPLGITDTSFGYTVANVADRYADQQLAYPVAVTGFGGLATFRTLAIGATVDTSPKLTTSLTLRLHDDFPKPAQGLFPVVDAAPLGQNSYPYQLGEPPADVTLTFRIRINPQLTLDVTDTQFIDAHGWPTNNFQFLLRP